MADQADDLEVIASFRNHHTAVGVSDKITGPSCAGLARFVELT
jgi:hypothetical protein